jgi:hypothetical protein
VTFYQQRFNNREWVTIEDVKVIEELKEMMHEKLQSSDWGTFG